MQALVTMKGFFNRKVRYRIESVHDFVLKLQQDKLKGYCQAFLAQDDPNWGGFKLLFEDFYQHVKDAMR